MIKKDFKLPLVHITQVGTPIDNVLNDCVGYSLKAFVQRYQEEIDEKIMLNIRQIMKEKGISDYYAIDEKRLLEIVEEAKAFEIIKEKQVDVYWLWLSVGVEKYNDVMNKKFIDSQKHILTQEEYDILKRRL